MRNELQKRSQNSPESRPRNMQNLQSNEPEGPYSKRILQLRDDPVLQRAPGKVNMVAEVHAIKMLGHATGSKFGSV